jgi:hypothetical protein
MKTILLAVVALGAFSVAASAEPVKLTKEQMASVTAGGQQNFPPGQFPAGNPAQAPGKSNPTPPR